MSDQNPSFGRRAAPPQPTEPSIPEDDIVASAHIMSQARPETPMRRHRHLSLSALALCVALGVTLAIIRLTGTHSPSAATPVVTAPPPTAADLTIVAPDVTILRAFPNTTIHYYDVPGVATADIVTFLKSGGPQSHLNSAGEGWTSWHMDWTWPQSDSGECETTAVKVTFRADVSLPRFVDFDRMDLAHQAAWDRYLNALIVHEAGHLSNGYQHMGEVAQAIRGQDCYGAQTAGQNAIDKLAAYDVAYDAQTQRGLLQGVIYPAN